MLQQLVVCNTRQRFLIADVCSFIRFPLTRLAILVWLASWSCLKAGPWVAVDDVWLRADIELLAELNIIKTPVTTYPLMWSNIAKALDETSIDEVPARYKATYWRVKKALQGSFSKYGRSELEFSLANQYQPLRSYGEFRAEEAMLTARRQQMYDDIAWNLEVSYLSDPSDEDDVRLDGSYLAGVIGNWNLSFGWIDRWWGPTWGSATLVSNNARPLPAFMLQRNYATPFESDWLSWIGSWTLNTFIGVLDDERYIEDAKLLGIAVNFKPLDNLEVALRRSAQWGGEGRDESASSFFNLLLGRDNCGSDGISCDDDDLEPGNQLAGIDLKYQPFTGNPLSVYFSAIGEDEAGYLPAKNTFQFGVTSQLPFLENWRYYLEFSDTSVSGDLYDILYEHHIYRSGYRYNGLSIGSTYDNDSTAVILGVTGYINREHQVSMKLQSIELNQNAAENTDRAVHSLAPLGYEGTILDLVWRTDLGERGVVNVKASLFSDTDSANNYFSEQFILGLNWKYQLK